MNDQVKAEKGAKPSRVSASPEALYSKPVRARKRRRCDGHLAERHSIEAGDLCVSSALPPGSDIGNDRWWHAVFCMDCAPAECVPSPGTQGGAS